VSCVGTNAEPPRERLALGTAESWSARRSSANVFEAAAPRSRGSPLEPETGASTASAPTTTTMTTTGRHDRAAVRARSRPPVGGPNAARRPARSPVAEQAENGGQHDQSGEAGEQADGDPRGERLQDIRGKRVARQGGGHGQSAAGPVRPAVASVASGRVRPRDRRPVLLGIERPRQAESMPDRAEGGGQVTAKRYRVKPGAGATRGATTATPPMVNGMRARWPIRTRQQHTAVRGWRPARPGPVPFHTE